MANKAVINVDINDSQFTAFYELFQQFEDKLGKMPESWKAINESSGDANAAIAAGAGALVESLLVASNHAKTLGDHLRLAGNAQKEFGHASHVGRSNLSLMAKDAKSLADSVFGIGKWLLKWGTIGVGSGIAGLFGLDKLAETVVSNQRGARTLGLTTGQMSAFGPTLGRYIDDSTLASVADAQNDYTKRAWLTRALGMSQNEVINADAGTLSAKLAMKAHDWWASTPTAQHTEANLMATGILQAGMSFGEVRRNGGTARSELEQGYGRYLTQSRLLNVSDATANGWFQFSQQLTLAGQALETKFTNQLVNLRGPLGGLIHTIEKDAELLVDSVFSKGNIDAISGGIDTLAKYLGSADFRADARALADDIGAIAKAIAGALHLIAPDGTPTTTDANGKLIPLGSLAPSTLKPGEVDVHSTGLDYWKNPDNGNPTSTLFHGGNYTTKRYLGGLFATHDKYMGPYYEQMNPDTELGRKNAATLAALEKTFGLPAGLLLAQETVESKGNLHAVSPKGATGPFQLMPATAKAYGVTNSFDFNQSAVAAARLDADLLRSSKGDLAKSMAGYNWGAGNVKNAGDDWQAQAPTETKNYIGRVVAAMAKQNAKPVKIEVTNKAGANIAISTNAGSI